ncbi:hypothetical protein INT47_010148 [Mucor saturninus]|uniref:BHLH domain-containing protein n=2 Tax=Mucor TaxID=4830 RepID=A0A8H7RDW0_9FUNG|nr:hypothetical protein INT47_010148 [Mucor saturninus]
MTEEISTTHEMPPPSSKKRKRSEPVKITAAPSVALPPPIMPYPHLVPSYYPVYQHPSYFLSVGQPPISPSLSPTLPSSPQRILPKSPNAALAPTYNYFPYPVQMSPQLHPTTTVRNNSVSSTGSSTTADQREQARKVSHSAIERRRREKINDKILQLKDLIPACTDRENLHKMTILQSAIDYITYLKTVIEELDTTGAIQTECTKPIQQSSMLPKEVEPFTSQFSINDEEDAWSVSSSSPKLKSLKPMDVINLNKASTPPTIVVHEHTSLDRNMNLENILC